MPIALTSVRNPFVSNKLCWPVATATIDHPIEPTVKMTKPHPVTRVPRFAAVIIAAIIVAAGAIQPANSSTQKFL